MKLKGRKKLVRKVQKFCDNFGCVAKMKTDFYSYPTERKVFFSPFIPSVETDNAFMDNAYKMGLNYDCGNFIISLLHEIGHCETWFLLTDEEKDFYYDESERIKDLEKDTAKNKKILFENTFEKITKNSRN